MAGGGGQFCDCPASLTGSGQFCGAYTGPESFFWGTDSWLLMLQLELGSQFSVLCLPGDGETLCRELPHKPCSQDSLAGRLCKDGFANTPNRFVCMHTEETGESSTPPRGWRQWRSEDRWAEMKTQVCFLRFVWCFPPKWALTASFNNRAFCMKYRYLVIFLRLQVGDMALWCKHST